MTQRRRTPSGLSGRAIRPIRVRSVEPILVRERTAARLLDMKPAEFRTLVEVGALPQPRCIVPGVERWYVPDLDAVASGTELEEEFEP